MSPQNCVFFDIRSLALACVTCGSILRDWNAVTKSGSTAYVAQQLNVDFTNELPGATPKAFVLAWHQLQRPPECEEGPKLKTGWSLPRRRVFGQGCRRCRRRERRIKILPGWKNLEFSMTHKMLFLFFHISIFQISEKHFWIESFWHLKSIILLSSLCVVPVCHWFFLLWRVSPLWWDGEGPRVPMIDERPSQRLYFSVDLTTYSYPLEFES